MKIFFKFFFISVGCFLHFFQLFCHSGGHPDNYPDTCLVATFGLHGRLPVVAVVLKHDFAQ